MTKRPFSSWQDRAALGLIVLSLALLAVPRAIRVSASRPFELVLLSPLRLVSAVSTHVLSLKAENRRLEELAARLAVENARLQTLCSPDTAAPASNFPMKRARVIARDMTSFEHYLVVGRGAGDGCRAGAPVISPAGLVGKAIASGPHQSLVQTILATDSRVSVMSKRSRIVGLARPEAGARLALDYVPRSADVAIGDTLVTAGLGGIFPAGIPVATVVSLPDRPSALFRPVIAKPFINMATIEYVFILLMPAEPADDWLGNTARPEVELPDEP